MPDKKVHAVRGSELRKKMEASLEKGENYRSGHQGADQIDTNTRHDGLTRNRSSSAHSSKK
ncbi:hypothetical protein AB1A81_07980 [Bdellovibrio bacteriovorus]|uniref:Uncharacterized protein n=1 Tax=Bdellovibrio bacteriovorus (strain ATCC 15356 / DSM 50701 / NCIMB 9529 / HD100) TaxID=264462 RepID=Q6MM91_BDEBA|nr:hypothetical protein [Bdellovibrio bacteriovorus]AHZ84268.1 hypothetical protein EP01_04840 [Bdellovibrio bacteriovorus]BEV68154.1 hypothetical protein Bb109J_c1574 [Bdellovibrio bacteriovorus]CAE79614.1 hypothetical protein predicted by Glimmer/Critica [Bdellovibrio bacteriovorus HD100]